MFLNKILITHPPPHPPTHVLWGLVPATRPASPPAVTRCPPTNKRKPYKPKKLDLQAGIVDKWFRRQPGVIRDAHLVPHSHGTKVHCVALYHSVELYTAPPWSKVQYSEQTVSCGG